MGTQLRNERMGQSRAGEGMVGSLDFAPQRAVRANDLNGHRHNVGLQFGSLSVTPPRH